MRQASTRLPWRSCSAKAFKPGTTPPSVPLIAPSRSDDDLGLPPPAPNCNAAPDEFDDAKRLRPLEEAVDRRPDARTGKGQHERRPALLESVEEEHGAHSQRAERGEEVHEDQSRSGPMWRSPLSIVALTFTDFGGAVACPGSTGTSPTISRPTVRQLTA